MHIFRWIFTIKEKLDQVLNLNIDNTASPINVNHGYKVMLV